MQTVPIFPSVPRGTTYSVVFVPEGGNTEGNLRLAIEVNQQTCFRPELWQNQRLAAQKKRDTEKGTLGLVKDARRSFLNQRRARA